MSEQRTMTQATLPRPEAKRGFRVTGRFVLIALLAFFGVVGGVNALMVRFAVSTFGGVETESSYKAGLVFRLASEAAAKQDALGWQVELSLGQDHPQRVISVVVRDREGHAVSGLVGSAVLQRPADRRQDVALSLIEEKAGTYRSRVDAQPGQWDVALTLQDGSDAVYRSRNRMILRGPP